MLRHLLFPASRCFIFLCLGVRGRSPHPCASPLLCPSPMLSVSMCCMFASLVEAYAFVAVLHTPANKRPESPLGVVAGAPFILQLFALAFRLRVLFHGLTCLGLAVGLCGCVCVSALAFFCTLWLLLVMGGTKSARWGVVCVCL